MGTLTNYVKESLLDHLFGNAAWTPPAETWVALFLTAGGAPGDGGGGSEQTGSAYARQRVFKDTGAGSPFWETPAESGDVLVTSNNGDIQFPNPGGAWGNMNYVGIFDASTSGNMLWWGTTDAAMLAVPGDDVQFVSGALEIEFDAAGTISDYLETAILNHILRATAYTAEDTFLALLTAAPSDAGGGTEVTGGGYARVEINRDLATQPYWTAPSIFYLVSLSQDVPFAKATADWGKITHIGVYNAASAGDLLWWSAVPHRYVKASDTYVIHATEIALGFD